MRSMSHAAGRILPLRLHHGTLNAVILPTVLGFNEGVRAAAYARIRQAMGLPDDVDLAVEIERMNKKIGLPGLLSAMGLATDLINGMVSHPMSDLANRTNPGRSAPRSMWVCFARPCDANRRRPEYLATLMMEG